MKKIIGIGLGGCILDIAKGEISINQVEVIITKTKCKNTESWKETIELYKQTTWKEYSELAEQIFWQLLEEGKIEQPIVTGDPCPKGHLRWVESRAEIVWEDKDQAKIYHSRLKPKKVCLVFDGDSPFGQAIVESFSPEYNVIWTHSGAEVVQPGRSVQLDMNDFEQVDRLFQGIDRIDVMINPLPPFFSGNATNMETYSKAEAYLRSYIYRLKLASEKMDRSRIFNILSYYINCTFPEGAMYFGMCEYLRGITVNLAKEAIADTGYLYQLPAMGHAKVRTCSLRLTPTPIFGEDYIHTPTHKELLAWHEKGLEIFFDPKKIAQFIKYFAEEDAFPLSYVLSVDGTNLGSEKNKLPMPTYYTELFK